MHLALSISGVGRPECPHANPFSRVPPPHKGSPFLFDKKMADYLDGLYQGVNEHFNSEMKLEIQGETMGFEEKRALKHQVFAGRHWLGQQNKQLRLARASSSSSARSPASNTTFLPDGRLDRPSRLPRMPGALCASRRHRGPGASAAAGIRPGEPASTRSEEHTSELQSLR